MDESKYLSSEESQREILLHLDDETRREYDTFGHLRVQSAFQDRKFVVYQAAGRNNQGIQRPPVILARLHVLSFIARDENGCVVRLLNVETNKVEEITHVPRKVFGYPIFMSIPPAFMLKWDGHYFGGKVERTLSYIVLIKCRNKAEFFSKNNIYLETPNKMQDELYPHLKLDLDL